MMELAFPYSESENALIKPVVLVVYTWDMNINITSLTLDIALIIHIDWFRPTELDST